MFPLLFVLTVCVAIVSGEKLSAVQITESRLIGDPDINYINYPYQISLRATVLDADYQLNCDGAIITEKVILSAFNCVQRVPLQRFIAVPGITSINRDSPEGLKVNKIIGHKNYNPFTLDNNIAVIVLAKSFTFGLGVQPIQLARNNPDSGTKAVVTGSGAIAEGGLFSNTLQVINVTIVSRKICASSYLPFRRRITESMICASIEEGGKDACQGDSGRALVADGKLFGIASFGIGCGRPQFPGVYTAIAPFYDWIQATAKQYT